MTDKILIDRELLEDLLEFLLLHSNRWDGIKGKHPQEIAEQARAALSEPQQEAVAVVMIAIDEQNDWRNWHLKAIDIAAMKAALRPDMTVPLYLHPAPSVPEWPVLDKPAKVGCGRFHAGVSSRLVVEAAQRHYEYEVTPEKEAARIAQSTEAIDALVASAAPKATTTDDRKDAERYRWLRQYEVDSYKATGSLDRLDAAIDAAMDAQKGEKE